MSELKKPNGRLGLIWSRNIKKLKWYLFIIFRNFVAFGSEH